MATSDNVVSLGTRFYKDANVHELYVGYEGELKVKTHGVYAWSWVEKEKVEGGLDVVMTEICLMEDDGNEKLISVCRAIVAERKRVQHKANL
jgi:hypothetical protein